MFNLPQYLKLAKFLKIMGASLRVRQCNQNSIEDARTPQPGEIVFNTMRHRSSETVQRSGDFQSSANYIKVQTKKCI